jgi:universal stress protein E
MERFQNILCVVNPLKNASSAVRRAAELASIHAARLTLVDIAQEMPPALVDAGLLSENVRREFLEQHKTDIQSMLDKNAVSVEANIKVLAGIPFLEIIKEVLRGSHDLLIKPTDSPGRGLELLGTTDKHLLRKCPCPVWLVKPTRRKKYEHILAAVDSDPGKSNAALNTLILDLSSSLAARERTDLHVLSAWEVPGEQTLRSRVAKSELDLLLENFRKDHMRWLKQFTKPYAERCAKFHVHLLKGEAGKVIPAEAKKRGVDLIVMGTVGRSGIPGLFIGNTAERILSKIDCSVLAVKPEGFGCPIEI